MTRDTDVRSTEVDSSPTESEEDPTVQCTRRDFLRGNWFNDESPAEGGAAPVTDEPSPEASTPSLWAQAAKVLIILLTVGIVLVAVTPATGASSPPADCTEANAAVAAQAEQKARQLATELHTLEQSHPGLVPTQRLESINQSLAAGAEEFELGRYEAACTAFQTAAQQARGALMTYYPQATQANLAATERVLEHAGGDDPVNATQIRARHDRLTADLSKASSLSELRGVHARSQALLAAAQAGLQPSFFEQVLAALPPLITALLVLSGGGVIVQTWRLRRATGTDATRPAPARGQHRDD